MRLDPLNEAKIGDSVRPRGYTSSCPQVPARDSRLQGRHKKSRICSSFS